MNIPCLSIQNVNGYSYVPLKEMFQDALANSCTFESMYSSPQNKKIFRLDESMFCKNLSHLFPRIDNGLLLFSKYKLIFFQV